MAKRHGPERLDAACARAIAGIDEVYSIGGAQAIAALALGTDTVAAVDIVVTASGHRAAARSNVTQDVTVRLKKADPLPVTIRLADSVRLPEPPIEISAQLAWLCSLDEPRPKEAAWGDPRDSDRIVKEFGADRATEVKVQNPGIYHVKLWLVNKGDDGSRMAPGIC